MHKVPICCHSTRLICSFHAVLDRSQRLKPFEFQPLSKRQLDGKTWQKIRTINIDKMVSIIQDDGRRRRFCSRDLCLSALACTCASVRLHAPVPQCACMHLCHQELWLQGCLQAPLAS